MACTKARRWNARLSPARRPVRRRAGIAGDSPSLSPALHSSSPTSSVLSLFSVAHPCVATAPPPYPASLGRGECRGKDSGAQIRRPPSSEATAACGSGSLCPLERSGAGGKDGGVRIHRLPSSGATARRRIDPVASVTGNGLAGAGAPAARGSACFHPQEQQRRAYAGGSGSAGSTPIRPPSPSRLAAVGLARSIPVSGSREKKRNGDARVQPRAASPRLASPGPTPPPLREPQPAVRHHHGPRCAPAGSTSRRRRNRSPVLPPPVRGPEPMPRFVACGFCDLFGSTHMDLKH
uniref:Uncharacterized protein n=1 Tax=Oryza meridionalis TaxID=40149 RepID=A0A0E0FCH6_9ORYZ